MDEFNLPGSTDSIYVLQRVIKGSQIFYQSCFEHFEHQTIVNKRLNASTIALLECPPP